MKSQFIVNFVLFIIKDELFLFSVCHWSGKAFLVKDCKSPVCASEYLCGPEDLDITLNMGIHDCTTFVNIHQTCIISTVLISIKILDAQTDIYLYIFAYSISNSHWYYHTHLFEGFFLHGLLV